MKHINKLINYQILNHFQFDQDINKIKIKDDNIIWVNKNNDNKTIKLKIKPQRQALISKIQFKATNLQKINVVSQEINGTIMTKSIEILNKELDMFIIPLQTQYQVQMITVELQIRKQEDQNDTNDKVLNSIIHHLLIHQQINMQDCQSMEKTEKILSRYVEFKQTTPQNMIYKKKFINWYSRQQQKVRGCIKYGQMNQFLQNNQINQQIFQEFLANIKSYKIQHLTIKYTTKISLKSIALPFYQNLFAIILFKCNICNIEDLSFINSTKLEFISLLNNHIVYTKSLKKGPFKLEILALYYNKIQQINQISRLQLSNSGLDMNLIQPLGSFNFFIKIKKIKQKLFIDRQLKDYLQELKIEGNVIYPRNCFIKVLENKIFGQCNNRLFYTQQERQQQQQVDDILQMIDPNLFQQD